MFNSMKTQLKEKSGKEVKFVPQKSSLSRASRQGSESSISSLILDSTTPQNSVQNSASQNLNPPPSPTSVDVHQIKLLADGKVLSPKEVSVIAKKEDEWRGRLEKKDSEWSKKYEKREAELLKELSEKEAEWGNKERLLTEDLLKQTNELRDAFKLAEELKRKVIDYQEEKDQIESFQTQEMAKIKHLLLAKERENTELTTNLKESQSQVDSLKSEVSRLKPLEEKIADIEVGRLSRQAGEEGVERRRAEQRVQELEDSLSKNNEQITQCYKTIETLQTENQQLAESKEHLKQICEELKEEKNKLENEIKRFEDLAIRLSSIETELETRSREKEELVKQLDEEKQKFSNLETEINQSRERMENEVRDASRQSEDLVLRNAQLSQQADMALTESSALRQELEQALTNTSNVQAQLTLVMQEASKAKEDFAQLENESKSQVESSLRSSESVQQLTASVADLESRLAERNKTIRVLQQNLSDMKKTLRQREMKGSASEGNHIVSATPSTANPVPNSVSNIATISPSSETLVTINRETDINFQYLKHVIVKFLTSREYEAQQLTKAVATLLQLTAEEELLIKDTLDWKMSWFGSRPKLQDYS